MKKLLGLLVLAFVTVGGFAMGSAEKNTLEGVVSMKGNEPFSFLALTDSGGKVWKLTGLKAEELKSHQNARVKVVVKPLPGAPAGPLAAEVEVVSFTLSE